MIIIQMKGGLGNQLFQYALYRQLQAMGREVKMDDETGLRDDKQRDPVLSDLGLEYERASAEEIIRITDSAMDLVSRVRRKLTGRRTKRYDEKDGNFDPFVLEAEDAYLVGYWQSERFFPDSEVQRALRKDILNGLERSAQEFLSTTTDERSSFELLVKKSLLNSTIKTDDTSDTVSLHIRRGDYLQPGTVETFGGICTDAYYAEAVRRILAAHPDAQFYLFSNDPEYVETCIRQRSGFSSLHLVRTAADGLTRDAAELYLMSRCRHHILANSSFSWWGAWLGRQDEDGAPGMVIAPARWLNNKRMDDIYTADMIRISVPQE